MYWDVVGQGERAWGCTWAGGDVHEDGVGQGIMCMALGRAGDNLPGVGRCLARG